MAIVWLMWGVCVGLLIGAIRAQAIEAQNRELRAALQNVRTMAQLGYHKSIVVAVDRVLEQECAA